MSQRHRGVGLIDDLRITGERSSAGGEIVIAAVVCRDRVIVNGQCRSNERRLAAAQRPGTDRTATVKEGYDAAWRAAAAGHRGGEGDRLPNSLGFFDEATVVVVVVPLLDDLRIAGERSGFAIVIAIAAVVRGDGVVADAERRGGESRLSRPGPGGRQRAGADCIAAVEERHRSGWIGARPRHAAVKVTVWPGLLGLAEDVTVIVGSALLTVCASVVVLPLKLLSPL